MWRGGAGRHRTVYLVGKRGNDADCDWPVALNLAPLAPLHLLDGTAVVAAKGR